MKELLEKNYKIVMATPFIMFIMILILYPLGYVFSVSLTNSGITGMGSYIRISNYIDIFKNDDFWHSVSITTKYSLITLSSSMFIGVILAVVFKSVKLPMKRVIMGLIMIPMLMTPVAIGLLWQQIFNPMFGIINTILSFLNLPISMWISSSKTVLESLCIVGIWRITPFVLLVSSAGLSMIPNQLYEAGKIDGTNSFQAFIHITIPSLQNLIVIVFIFQMVTVLKVFDEIFVMTNGGPSDSSLTTYLYTYKTAFQYGKIGYASALGLIIFIVILILSYISIKLNRKTQ